MKPSLAVPAVVSAFEDHVTGASVLDITGNTSAPCHDGLQADFDV